MPHTCCCHIHPVLNVLMAVHLQMFYQVRCHGAPCTMGAMDDDMKVLQFHMAADVDRYSCSVVVRYLNVSLRCTRMRGNACFESSAV